MNMWSDDTDDHKTEYTFDGNWSKQNMIFQRGKQEANMAYLSGLKKQINKANQFMTEKISGVEGTKLDDDFYVMEKKSDLIVELVDDLQIKTKEYLQPNPTVRAKMAAVKGISKLSGQAKASTYPQPEGTLGEAMLTYGNKLQEYDREWVAYFIQEIFTIV